MAELGVLDIAKSLLEQLSSPAKDELLLWWNTKNELEKLKYTITTIKYVLHDAGQRQATDHAVRLWILRLRDVLYEADDLFDIISTRALRKRVIRGGRIVKNVRLFFSESNHLIFTITTAHKVKDLRQRLDHIAKDMEQYRFIMSAPVEDERPALKRREQSHSYVHEDDVVGREKEKKEILSMLLADAEGQERVSVIAVVGIGGLGKTTLAQYVYNAKEVTGHFDLQLWASVKYFSDLNTALEKIIASGTEQKQSGGLQLDQLQSMLRMKINGKKFLLVLDDVWEQSRERWLSLKALLRFGESGSKVLVTTRLKEVAENVATVSPWYALGELSDENAWLLFKRMAFDPSQEGEIEEKEELGKQIVKKCSNVPLAVRTIGSFLYHKDKKQWSKFAENELMKLIPDRENMIMQALKISYDDLPAVLKHCFAYFSLIPKGERFDKFFVTQLWAAQGLLQTSSENPCLEDVGENYFLFLLERCFIQDAYKDDIDERTTDYKMHDLFHDLAVEIAGREIIQVTNIPDDFKERSPRHVKVGEIKDSLFEVKGIRSLLSSRVGYVERPVLDALFLHLTSLRALSLTDLDVEEIPSSIGKLVHLRYLDLSCNKSLTKLPAALCKLQTLITLSLSQCPQLKKLPDDLHKLISLRHLKVESCVGLNHMPSGLKELTSLVTLDRLVVNKDHATLGCLKHLNNLSDFLEIVLPPGQWKNCIADAEESMLSSKTKLSELCISWNDSAEGEEMTEVDADAVLERLQPPNSIDRFELSIYPGKRFPEWVSSLKNLVRLHLNNCSNCVELPRLSQLYHLKGLELVSIPLVEYVEEGICNDATLFFPSLDYLRLIDMPRLKGWWKPSANEDHLLSFTTLSKLEVNNCPRLTRLPRCPFLNSLHIIDAHVDMFSELVAEVVSIQQLYIDEMPNLKRHCVLLALQHLTTLQEVYVRGICKTDSSVVNEDTWKSLTRLENLAFEFGSDAQGALLLNGLYHLTSLQGLYVFGNLPANDIDYSQWTPPPNLKRLGIIGLDEVAPVNRLIQQLQALSTLMIFESEWGEDELDELAWENLKGLTRLWFFSMATMKRVPDKCKLLPALTELQLQFCYEVTSLPDWITRLTTLGIYRCPALEGKCKKPTGLYWPLLRNIPNFYVV